MPGGMNHRGRGGYVSNMNETRGTEVFSNNHDSRVDHRGAYNEPPPPAQLNRCV